MSAVAAPAPAPEVSPERLGAAGLRAFERIAQAWGLSVDEQLCLLGQPPRSTYFAWRKPVSYTHLTLPTSDLV